MTLFLKGICNGTIGIVQEIYNTGHVRVAFPVNNGIVDVVLGQTTYHFYLDGSRASRQQYPLQNAFALTVHKTQGLTFAVITVALDEQIFAKGQAYVALSRAPSWSSLSITALSRDAFKVDRGMIAEHNRLFKIADAGLQII